MSDRKLKFNLRCLLLLALVLIAPLGIGAPAVTTGVGLSEGERYIADSSTGRKLEGRFFELRTSLSKLDARDYTAAELKQLTSRLSELQLSQSVLEQEFSIPVDSVTLLQALTLQRAGDIRMLLARVGLEEERIKEFCGQSPAEALDFAHELMNLANSGKLPERTRVAQTARAVASSCLARELLRG